MLLQASALSSSLPVGRWGAAVGWRGRAGRGGGAALCREGTPPEVREQREREKELRELDRDTRTVFAYNLNLKADEKDIFEFFSRAGQVEDVRIIMDRNTRRSKGFAYIEMATRVRCFGRLNLMHCMLHSRPALPVG